jgi:hypothetical protein
MVSEENSGPPTEAHETDSRRPSKPLKMASLHNVAGAPRAGPFSVPSPPSATKKGIPHTGGSADAGGVSLMQSQPPPELSIHEALKEIATGLRCAWCAVRLEGPPPVQHAHGDTGIHPWADWHAAKPRYCDKECRENAKRFPVAGTEGSA